MSSLWRFHSALCRIGQLSSSLQKTARCISTSSKIFEYEARYSPHDQEKILQVINAAETEALAQYNISKSRVGNIVKYRSKKGPFREVEELLEVDGFGVKILEKFCESVLGMTPASKQEPKLRGGAFCSPKPSDELLREIDVVTAIQLTPRKLSWAQLSRGRELLDWQSMSVNPNETKRYDLSAVLDMVLPLINLIPESDAYVIEDSAGSGGSQIQPAFFGVHLQLARIQAALVSMLERDSTTKSASPGHRRVFSMKPAHISKLFGVRVGGERVSGQKLVASIVTPANHPETAPSTPGRDFEFKTVPTFARLQRSSLPAQYDKWADMFLQSEPVDREMLSNSLLLSLAFQALVIEEAPECFRVLRS